MYQVIKKLIDLFGREQSDKLKKDVKEKLRKSVTEVLDDIDKYQASPLHDIKIQLGSTSSTTIMNSVEEISYPIIMTVSYREKTFQTDISIKLNKPITDSKINDAINKFRCDITEAYNGIVRSQ